MERCVRSSAPAGIAGTRRAEIATGRGATGLARVGAWIATLGLAVLCAGCMTVGRDFPVAPVDSIEIGTTTMADVHRLFGEPWRQGVEDGERTWTFAKYHYNVFGATQTRDLKVRFDAKDRVVAFSFNSTFPEDAQR
jgi:hypothetical protein